MFLQNVGCASSSLLKMGKPVWENRDMLWLILVPIWRGSKILSLERGDELLYMTYGMFCDAKPNRAQQDGKCNGCPLRVSS
jgi:hypothetical protein